MTLERQASAAGGKVHALLGNHEIMNMIAETRDVSPEVFSSFGGETVYRAAFGRDGKYGKWLRTKPILVNVDGTVFMHAGINLDSSKESLDELNRRARREVAEWDEGLRCSKNRTSSKPSAPIQEIVRAARTEVDRVNAIMTEKKHLEPGYRVVRNSCCRWRISAPRACSAAKARCGFGVLQPGATPRGPQRCRTS